MKIKVLTETIVVKLRENICNTMKRAWLITNRHYLCYYYIHVYFKGKLGEEVLDTTNMYYINLEMLYVQLYGPFKLKLFNPEGIMMNLYI